MARYYISIWDLHKEIENLTLNDPLRPPNHDKGPQWLGKRIKELPRPCDISTAAYKLRQLEYRSLWRDMAKKHKQVVSILTDASTSTSIRGYNCLFNQAMLQMVAFLEHFATRAAPFSMDGNDQFEILMDNFSTVIDTVCIFYDRFDCEGWSEILRTERDQGRDEKWVFCFVKNEPQPPMDLSEGLERVLNSSVASSGPSEDMSFEDLLGASTWEFNQGPVASPGLSEEMGFEDLLGVGTWEFNRGPVASPEPSKEMNVNVWELNQEPDDCWSQGREMPIAFHY